MHISPIFSCQVTIILAVSMQPVTMVVAYSYVPAYQSGQEGTTPTDSVLGMSFQSVHHRNEDETNMVCQLLQLQRSCGHSWGIHNCYICSWNVITKRDHVINNNISCHSVHVAMDNSNLAKGFQW